MKYLKIGKQALTIFVLIAFFFSSGVEGFSLNAAHQTKDERAVNIDNKDIEMKTGSNSDSAAAAAAPDEKNSRINYNVVEKPGVKDKKKFPLLLTVGGAVVVGALVYFLVIKKKKVEYTLAVTIGAGINGSPVSGTYTYTKGKTITYNYSLQPGYTDIHVALDGAAVSTGGTITMDRNHTLTASTTALGSISVQSTPDGADIWLDHANTGNKTNAILNNIMPGAHTVTLKKQGYWEFQTTITVESGKQAAITANLEKGVTIEWVKIPAGEFKMGDNFNEGVKDERPVHTVYLDDYYIGKYEVTFAQYDLFCEATGRTKPADQGWGRGNRPVINVTWYDAKAFCDWLAGKTGENIHLPYEAQWEKAARGTDQRRFPWGDNDPTCTLANFQPCGQKTMPVDTLPAGVSPYGIYHMGGNVWEWCQDWYDPTYYSISPYKNPKGPATGELKTRRAGCLYAIQVVLRSANRRNFDPNGSHDGGGFRVAKDQP